MDKWTEIKTAYHVARLGTVSATADFLGVHRATVNRHIDALEAELGAKLFYRNKTGYMATEAGEDLLRVGRTTEEQFNQLAQRTLNKNTKIEGDLIITAHERVAPILMPALQKFQDQNHDTVIKFIASSTTLNLEYGEAHIGVRSGQKPDQPDNVVQHFVDLKLGLYAHKNYVKKFGVPKSQSDFKNHRFVCWEVENSNFPFTAWFGKNVPKKNKSLTSSSQDVTDKAILSGMGIGFHPQIYAQQHSNLIEVLAPQSDWSVTLWLVTHVSLHRTAKVQAILKFLKDGSLR